LASEIVFQLKGRKPRQIPLARMAAYMAEFAALIGTSEPVLFSEIREGSTCIAANPRGNGSASVIRRRIISASRGEGPKDARAAFRHLTELANADRARAKVTDGSTTIVHLPSNLPVYDPLKLIERGHITGILEGVYRDGNAVKARIRPDGESIIYCTATAAIGKNMGSLFLDHIRAFGSGTWRRSQSGKWVCESMHIESISKVSAAPLRAAVDELRTLDLAWEEDPWADFDEVAGHA
jgi:hypothetical protein